MVESLILAAALVLEPPALDGTADAVAEKNGAAPVVDASSDPKGPQPMRSTLQVAVAGSEPFVVAGSEPRGIAVDIWREVADRGQFEYELTAVESIPEALEGVERGQFDVAVGPVSITPQRAQSLAFTQPYYQASLSILADPASGSAWSRIKPFLSRAFLVGVSALLFVLGIVGVLFWITERKRNPEQFPSNPIRGIGNGLWLALVTMTTVGYGDRAPVSVAGRVVAGIWMVIAMLTASSLTASIATALTLSQLDRVAIAEAGELKGRRVAAVTDSPGERFARDHGARVVVADDLNRAIELVLQGRTEALVHDRPILRYYLHEHPDAQLALSDATYMSRGYGFALPHRSPHLRTVDVKILELQQENEIARMAERWMGSGTSGS